MEFDISKFASSSFNHREEAVPVPDLKHLFTGEPEKDGNGKDKPPVWVVRGLSGEELARAREAKERNSRRNAVIEGIASGTAAGVAEAIREIMGATATVPDDLAQRLEMLVLGSVNPECSHQTAVKLSQYYPVEFYSLTNAITKLTGMGAEPGKPKRSSGSQKSK